MESFFLLLRVIVSLAAVFGLLFYLRKRLASRFGSPRAAQLDIVERRSLGAKSSVVLLDVQGRRYLLGVAESSVSVLDSFEAPEPVVSETPGAGADPAPSFASVLEALRTPAPGQPAAHPGGPADPAVPAAAPGPLAGSILSAQTWRRAAAAIRQGRGA